LLFDVKINDVKISEAMVIDAWNAVSQIWIFNNAKLNPSTFFVNLKNSGVGTHRFHYT
jgi:hypothetical protein